MTKQDKAVFNQWCREYDIDPRTLKMIGQHYLYLGEQVIANLTQDDIKETVAREQKRQQEAEARGCIYLIDPSFTDYLLKAVVGLHKIDSTIRYKILREII